jgi:hypothetical protein
MWTSTARGCSEPDAKPLTAVGETFEIEMDRRPLGGIPNTEALLNLVRDVGDYKVRCTVARLIPNRLIEWTVQAEGKPPGGHVYGWQIEPDSDNACVVTNYCDWTNISDELRAKFRWPVVPVEQLQRSLENLKRLAASQKDR